MQRYDHETERGGWVSMNQCAYDLLEVSKRNVLNAIRQAGRVGHSVDEQIGWFRPLWLKVVGLEFELVIVEPKSILRLVEQFIVHQYILYAHATSAFLYTLL